MRGISKDWCRGTTRCIEYFLGYSGVTKEVSKVTWKKVVNK